MLCTAGMELIQGRRAPTTLEGASRIIISFLRGDLLEIAPETVCVGYDVVYVVRDEATCRQDEREHGVIELSSRRGRWVWSGIHETGRTDVGERGGGG